MIARTQREFLPAPDGTAESLRVLARVLLDYERLLYLLYAQLVALCGVAVVHHVVDDVYPTDQPKILVLEHHLQSRNERGAMTEGEGECA